MSKGQLVDGRLGTSENDGIAVIAVRDFGGKFVTDINREKELDVKGRGEIEGANPGTPGVGS